MNLEAIANNIEKKDGIYYSKDNSRISYPEEGNENCLQIEQDSFWFNHRNHVIIETVKTFSPNSFFFDIGGGNGFVSKGLQNSGFKVALVEPGNVGTINAKSRNIDNIICSTLEDAEFKPETMDSVGLFDVVEHIEDDLNFLSEIHNYLKSEGHVFITVPAHNMLWSREDLKAGHYRRYSLSGITQLLEKSGFKVEYSTYFFTILPIPIFLFRSIPSKLKLTKNSYDRLSKNKKEHSTKKSIINDIMKKVWNWELSYIKKLKKLNFGGSCLVVGKKLKENNI